MVKQENNQSPYNAVALCAVGTEKVVSNELKKLDLKVIESAYGKVRFKADITELYRSLMGLRAADRVLLEAGCFHAADFDALFEKTQETAWEKLVPANAGLKIVKVRSSGSRLKAETSIQSITHKAAAQRLCKHSGLSRLPDTDQAAEARVYVEKDTVSLLLDLSGEPLFKRGYRRDGGIAPLRETTAAAMILLSGWKRKYPLYDPFCGSGTILAEALMYAWDMAPCLGRGEKSPEFALDRLLIADKKIEETVRAEFRARINFERQIRLAGSDGDPECSALALSNLKNVHALAGNRAENNEPTGRLPLVTTTPMNMARPPFEVKDEPRGFIITNPPYGKRLGDVEASLVIYREMSILAKNFPGWKLAVISDHPGFESFFGRKADSCREITGGAIPAFFYQYEKL
ncbi:MAG: class I SAM-dependent RNA methyltransferase [Treponema sp.]|nr:class I SAM-dependent RNA methyltransferase [Treponema sp.]